MAVEFASELDPRESALESIGGGIRTRRSLLAGAAAAAGALVASALGRPTPASAASIVLGGVNNETSATVINNTAANVNAKGVIARTTYTGAAANSAGLSGESRGRNGRGVLGKAAAGTGVQGDGGHTGVLGEGTNYGVRGTSENNYGIFGEGGYSGVFGSGPYGTYGSGTSAGAIGTSGPGYGLYGVGSIGAVGIGDGNGYGAWGYNADSGGYGVVGQGGYRGLYGSGGNAGVYGTSGYVGVWGNASTTSGLNFGVYGYSGSSGGYAGVFSGAVQVSGFLSKLGGGFKIDHPLEPDRRYLVHSFVESPEMLNVYSGTVALDARGRATVRLPRYFEAANGDYRYQLTAVGGAAPELHVAKRIERNRFTIAGGTPGLEVSWQISGVRQDAWAKANPMRVEPLKSRRDQGKFLSPEAFGKPKALAIYALREPAADRLRALRRRPELLVRQPTADRG